MIINANEVRDLRATPIRREFDVSMAHDRCYVPPVRKTVAYEIEFEYTGSDTNGLLNAWRSGNCCTVNADGYHFGLLISAVHLDQPIDAITSFRVTGKTHGRVSVPSEKKAYAYPSWRAFCRVCQVRYVVPGTLFCHIHAGHIHTAQSLGRINRFGPAVRVTYPAANRIIQAAIADRVSFDIETARRWMDILTFDFGPLEKRIYDHYMGLLRIPKDSLKPGDRINITVRGSYVTGADCDRYIMDTLNRKGKAVDSFMAQYITASEKANPRTHKFYIGSDSAFTRTQLTKAPVGERKLVPWAKKTRAECIAQAEEMLNDDPNREEVVIVKVVAVVKRKKVPVIVEEVK